MPDITQETPRTHDAVIASREQLLALQEEFKIRVSDYEQFAKQIDTILSSLLSLTIEVQKYKDQAFVDASFYNDMVSRLNSAAAALQGGEH